MGILEQSKQISRWRRLPMRTLEHHAQILACKDELVDQLPHGRLIPIDWCLRADIVQPWLSNCIYAAR
jgi:hypothetical protein